MPLIMIPPFKAQALYYDAVIADTPRHYYRLNETTGVNPANDPNALDGAYNMSVNNSGAMTWQVSGGSGGDDNRAVESSSLIGTSGGSFNVATPLAYKDKGTFELIYAPRSTPTSSAATIHYVLNSTHRAGAGGGRHLEIRYEAFYGGGAPGTVNVEATFYHAGNTDSPITKISTATTLTLDEYSHLAVTYDNTGSPSEMQLFVNGVGSGPTSMTNTGNGYFQGTTQLAIHGVSTSGGMYSGVDGVADEVALYDYVLSDARIAAHAALVKGGTI